MTSQIRKYQHAPTTVDAIEYTGSSEDAAAVIEWVAKNRGLCFPAEELLFRHDMGTYYHREHGFVYLPQGARRPGQAIEPLRDNELIVRTDTNIYAVVFPGDYVLRSRSGFYPLTAESFDRSYLANARRRGTLPVLSPAS